MKKTEFNGYCICIHCGARIPHPRGKPCRNLHCPDCGKQMMREGGYHHQLYTEKKGELKNESSDPNTGECGG